MRPASLLSSLFALVLVLGACKSTGDDLQASRSNADEIVALAQQEIAEGRHLEALERLLALRKVTGLPPDLRAEVERLTEQSAQVVLDETSGPGFDSQDLLAIYELDLPIRYRALAGILAADRMIDEGRRVAAFKRIRKLDRDHPTHPQRARAGRVVARAGLSLIRDPGRYYLIFKYRTRGMQALEYLVLQYPRDPSCDEAYSELAAYYEREGDIDLAIDRHEDLLVYHPQSPFTPNSAARLPFLRLERLKRNDYDRRELLIANREVERWLARYPGHELEGWVRELGAECSKRLAENDIYLARFYRRVGSSFGARIHAQRALRTAEDAGLEKQTTRAQALLASLPEEDDWRVDVTPEEPLPETEVEP